MSLENLDIRKYIYIKGARENNLKNIDIALKRNQLIVITGVSGSGKTTLAFDTLFAEGQRMYVESLNSYARQFLGRMKKPEVDYIKGISPAIAIEQNVLSKNQQSTIGMSTEIYDYLKLLFTHIGITYSPISGKQVKKDNISSIIDDLFSLPLNTRFAISFSSVLSKEEKEKDLYLLIQKGFSRVFFKKSIITIEALLKEKEIKDTSIEVIVDRNTVSSQKSIKERAVDSLETAFFEGKGSCSLFLFDMKGKYTKKNYSDKFELDGISFQQPNLHFFSFNNSMGMCRNCEGKGVLFSIDKKLVFPNRELSVAHGGIYPWRGQFKEWENKLLSKARLFDFPTHRAYEHLEEKEKKLLWTGNEYFKGLHSFFFMLEKENTLRARMTLLKYKSIIPCENCMGTRIRYDASYVKINGKSILDILLMPLTEVSAFFKNIKLSSYEKEVSKILLEEIKNRLSYLEKVGLGYLTLNRRSATLSGGESQRVKLANSLGSSLVGSMYILDEPSIGLHPKDTKNLIDILKKLTKLGNTVIVVEHEEDIIKAADEVIDIGPEAGAWGGELIFQGKVENLEKAENSYTAKYITKQITIPRKEKKVLTKYIQLKKANKNNLKNITVKIPLNGFVVVTGVSGSGKSTLIYEELYTRLQLFFETKNNIEESLNGDLNAISEVEFIGQHAIGRNSRSTPATYIGIYEYIRNLFAHQKEALTNRITKHHFSMNTEGGRCEECMGNGYMKIEMQFMADIHLVCESCKGKKFQKEILEIEYNGKNIYDILELTIDEAVLYFSEHKAIAEPLKIMQKIGLGYLKLGQSCSALSGGESQRLKLVSFITRKNLVTKKNILFIFDEPSIGLHFHDIKKLLIAFNTLIEKGKHSIIIIEHNKEIIKQADWIIDLGPEGGDKGGWICYQGTPEDMIKIKKNATAECLKSSF